MTVLNTWITKVLDRSGSMAENGKDEGTVAGYNAFLEDQKKLDGELRISLIQFDTIIETVYEGLSAHEAPRLKLGKPVWPISTTGAITTTTIGTGIRGFSEEKKEEGFHLFQPRGGTALLDAVAFAIKTTEERLEKAKEFGPRPDKILILVMTDGDENSSTTWTKETLAQLVSSKRSAGWDFAFIGADMDAWTVGAGFGVSRTSSMVIPGTRDGYTTAFAAASASSLAYRSATLDGNNFFNQDGSGEE